MYTYINGSTAPIKQTKVKENDIDLIDWYVIQYNIMIKIDSIVII